MAVTVSSWASKNDIDKSESVSIVSEILRKNVKGSTVLSVDDLNVLSIAVAKGHSRSDKETFKAKQYMFLCSCVGFEDQEFSGCDETEALMKFKNVNPNIKTKPVKAVKVE